MGWLLQVLFLTMQMHDHAAMTAATDGKFNPWIVADGKDGFYSVYVQRTRGASDVMLQHSLNRKLSAPVRVNDRPGDGAVRNENPPKIAVGAAGEVFVVWASEKERWKGNIRFARSADGGRTFSKAIDVNSEGNRPPVGRAFESIVVDPKGRIYVAWIDERNKKESSRGAEIWIATSDDQGRTFSTDRRIVSDVCECCRTTLVVDSAGSVYLSYRLVPSSGPMFRDIAVARSDDRGKNFVSSAIHQDGWELNACPIAGATMTIDAANRLYVTWFTEFQGKPRLMVATSSDKGRTFGTPRALDADQTLAKHAHLVPMSGDQLAVAWDDTEQGQPVVRWGILSAGSLTVKRLGAKPGSYPVIAFNGKTTEVVALPPVNVTEIVRIRN